MIFLPTQEGRRLRPNFSVERTFDADGILRLRADLYIRDHKDRPPLGSATVLKIKRADLRSPATGFHVSASH